MTGKRAENKLAQAGDGSIYLYPVRVLETHRKITMNQEKINVRENLIARLNRIEGQVRGIHKMIESERACPDILRQIAATDAALRAVAKLIVTHHMDCCFEGALDDSSTRKQLLKDVLEAFGRFG